MGTIKEKYGYLPTSVWHLSKSKTLKIAAADNSKAREVKRSQSSKYLPNLSFSEFNPNVAKRIIEYWSDEGDTILDPFAGRSTRMIVSRLLNRNYIGFEISPIAYEDLIEKSQGNRQKTLSGKRNDVQIYLDDGCKLSRIKDESVHMIFTCPPYWNLERYENCENQLSECKTYDEFIRHIQECSIRCYDVIKKDKFCVWVVSDFRVGGFKAFHRDIMSIFEEAGFKIWDVVINVLNSPFAYCQIGKCEKQKYTSKTHEYILVFRK